MYNRRIQAYDGTPRWLLNAAIFFVFIAAIYSASPAIGGGDTAAYWRFEPDGLLKDSSGADRELLPVADGVTAGESIAPDPVPATGAESRGAAVFGGHGAARVPTDGSDVLALADGQEFTFECWLRTGDNIGVSVLLSKVHKDPASPSTRAEGFDFLTIPGRGGGPGAPLHFRIYTRRDHLLYLIAVDNALHPNHTYHIALTRRDTTYRVYIDGILRGEATCAETIAGDSDIFIGTLGHGDEPFGGHYQSGGTIIDEARLTLRALLPDEFLLFPRATKAVARLSFGPQDHGPGAGWQPAAGRLITSDTTAGGHSIARDRPLRQLPDNTIAESVLRTGRVGMRRLTIEAIPAVYDLRMHFCEIDSELSAQGQRVFDVAVNGRRVLNRFDIFAAADGRQKPVSHKFEQFPCPDGRVYLEFMAHTDKKPLLNAIELVASDRGLQRVVRRRQRGPASGWEISPPPFDRLIPDPITLEHKTFTAANDAVSFPYVPSMKFAPYPQRLKPNTRSRVRGITKLADDRQRPVEGGIQFSHETGGYFEIHHRRAGARCENGARFRLRMEQFKRLGTVAVGVRVDGDIYPLREFDQQSMTVRAGRVDYVLRHDKLQLTARVRAVAPVSVPAYGVLCSISIENDTDQSRAIELITAAGSGRRVQWELPKNASGGRGYITIDTPREDPDSVLLHDTNYSVYVGLDSEPQLLSDRALCRPLNIEAGSRARAYMLAVIDSPAYDREAVRERISGYFANNKKLPEGVRDEMTEKAINTFARIVVNGDRSFKRVRERPAATFDASCKLCERGVYRDAPVRFQLPDKKLQALANLVANDLFPGIVQSPGMVHDAKYGDNRNYIFCYRHVHAASDIALEDPAIDYMRLLSANQQSNGRISSLRADFKSPGHGTQFDASYIDALRHYYKWTGDLDAVRQLWPTITRAAEYLDRKLDPDGDHLYRDLIHQWKSDFDNRGPSSSFQTAIVWRAYRDLAKLAGKLGHGNQADTYRKKAANIRKAAMEQLWSDERVMLAAKGPLGMLRLHPQSLEVEIPVWTEFVDDYQAAVLTDWYRHNLGFSDDDGGLWMYDNDWWPVVWSQHTASPGDYMMVGRALMLTGDYRAGCRTLQTVAAGSFRSRSPGFSYTFDEHGRQGGNDPATAQGAFFRTLVEGLFGVTPKLDEDTIMVRPRMPEDWNHARFTRDGLDYEWRRDGDSQTVIVETNPEVTAIIEFPVRAPVENVTVDGKAADYETTPAMRRTIVSVRAPAGGGTVAIRTDSEGTVEVRAPSRADVGDTVELQVNGADEYTIDDRFDFFGIVSEGADGARLKLQKAGCGRAVVFLRCSTGNVTWIEPVFVSTRPETPLEIQRRTCTEGPPEGASWLPVDLSAAYNDDIQRCFNHRWKWDARDGTGGRIRYWTMPLFKLSTQLPRRVRMKGVPFLLGPMGPEEAANEKDLYMMANTAPRELPTGIEFDLANRHLHKIYLLSLNMILPQKCYVPAVEATVRYSDGTEATTRLIPPLNFDAFYQDFAVNTLALPLPAQQGYGMDSWVRYGGVDLKQHHLTMTDIACDPDREAASVQLRSIATETFMGLAGMTLLARR